MRRNVLQSQLAESLALADEVIVAAVFKSDAIPESERLDLMAVSSEVQRHGPRARVISNVNGIVDIVALELRPGDVVAILSNGGFDGIYEKLPARLQALSTGASGPSDANSREASAKA